MRSSRLGGLLLIAGAAAVASCDSSCPNLYPIKGMQIVTFEMRATPTARGLDECSDAGYSEIPLPDASFTFRAIFTGEEDGTVQWMTIQEYVRDASYDGVLLFSSHSAPRYFGLCGDAGVYEELYVAPISLTQWAAMGRQCPEDPTAPGAIPVDPDAGIYPPGWFNDHFEAVHGCGLLKDTIHEVGDRPCPSCTMTFQAAGPRL
jgi:hypothetical protein